MYPPACFIAPEEIMAAIRASASFADIHLRSREMYILISFGVIASLPLLRKSAAAHMLISSDIRASYSVPVYMMCALYARVRYLIFH